MKKTVGRSTVTCQVGIGEIGRQVRWGGPIATGDQLFCATSERKLGKVRRRILTKECKPGGPNEGLRSSFEVRMRACVGQAECEERAEVWQTAVAQMKQDRV